MIPKYPTKEEIDAAIGDGDAMSHIEEEIYLCRQAERTAARKLANERQSVFDERNEEEYRMWLSWHTDEERLTWQS